MIGKRIIVESNITYNAFICDQITKLVGDLLDKPCTVLDFGCGNGQLTNFVQNAFFNASVVGIDKNSISVDQARQKYQGIEFVALFDKELPFENNIFDLIYAINVFHHIPPMQHHFYSKEMLRILKPNGRIIIFELNPYNVFTWLRFKKDISEKDNCMVSARQIISLFNDTRYRIQLKYYFVSPFVPVKNYIGFLPLGSLYSVLVYP